MGKCHLLQFYFSDVCVGIELLEQMMNRILCEHDVYILYGKVISEKSRMYEHTWKFYRDKEAWDAAFYDVSD